MILLLLQETIKMPDSANFWATISLIVIFVIEMLRRVATRRWEKQDRLIEASEASDDRRQVAEKIKDELKLYQTQLDVKSDREKLDRERTALDVARKLDEHDSLVLKTLNKNNSTIIEQATTNIKPIVQDVKGDLITAIRENTEVAAKAFKTASDTFEISNTINDKLAKMSEAGLLTKTEEDGRAGIKNEEAKKDAK